MKVFLSASGSSPDAYNLLERFILSWGVLKDLKSDYCDGIFSISRLGLDADRPQGTKSADSHALYRTELFTSGVLIGELLCGRKGFD